MQLSRTVKGLMGGGLASNHTWSNCIVAGVLYCMRTGDEGKGEVVPVHRIGPL